jgi:organic hydroperoxide reductase OsmC/OhrA
VPVPLSFCTEYRADPPRRRPKASSDPAFCGDAHRYNLEELLVASVSSCHMLCYLHLCAIAGVNVVGYRDDLLGTMVEDTNGSSRITGVVLRPQIALSAGADRERATVLHAEARASSPTR